MGKFSIEFEGHFPTFISFRGNMVRIVTIIEFLIIEEYRRINEIGLIYFWFLLIQLIRHSKHIFGSSLSTSPIDLV